VRWLVALGRSPLSDAALVDGEVHAVRSLIVRQAMSQGRNSNRATAEIIVRLLGRHPDEEDSSDEDEDFAGVGRGPLRGRKKGSRVGDEFQAKVRCIAALCAVLTLNSQSNGVAQLQTAESRMHWRATGARAAGVVCSRT
jgi:hypothetical protein